MKFLILSLIICQFSLANETLSQITKRSLEKQIKALQIVDQGLEDKISDYTKSFNYYIQSREKECTGEFIAIEVGENKIQERKKSKLSSEERKSCLLELVYFRKKHVNELFKLRAKSLKLEHKSQLSRLDDIKKESLKALDQLSEKLK
jgi:hypothetical protein